MPRGGAQPHFVLRTNSSIDEIINYLRQYFASSTHIDIELISSDYLDNTEFYSNIHKHHFKDIINVINHGYTSAGSERLSESVRFGNLTKRVPRDVLVQLRSYLDSLHHQEAITKTWSPKVSTLATGHPAVTRLHNSSMHRLR